MHRLRVIACAFAFVLINCVGGFASPVRSVSVLVVWRFDAPQASNADVQAVEAGLVAVNFLPAALDALKRHPSAKMTIALDPAFISSLTRAAGGKDDLGNLARGTMDTSDAAAVQLRDVLATSVVPVTALRATPAGNRFVADAAAARLAVMKGNPEESQAFDVDYAATAILLSLEGAGYARGDQALLAKDRLTGSDLLALAQQFASACHDVVLRLQTSAHNGDVELAALPAYEPILPLIIDAAGRSVRVPFTVAFDATADAAQAIDQGMRAVRELDPGAGNPGIVSPSGAYDDETVALMQAHKSRYAVFSERVVKMNVGAAVSSVAQAHGAAFQAYLMETSRTDTMPIFFSSDTASASIDSQPINSPPSAMADRMRAIVAAAATAAPNGSAAVVTLSLPGTGSILHRANRAEALDALAAALSTPNVRGVTPREFLAAHPPTADTYGYEAASDAGDFNLWMGSQNQMSLWNALLDARQAAGGDAALSRPQIRDSLLQAESGRWFLALDLPQPRYLTDALLAQFRTLIAQIYQAAGKPAPANIAPIKLNETPAASPVPSAPAPANSPSPAPSTTPAATPNAASPSPRASASKT
jgi:hypothetical protein